MKKIDEANSIGPGLVLTRKVGQEITVEHGLLRIQVVQIKGKQVRLKFVGNVQVDRAERLEKMEAEDVSKD